MPYLFVLIAVALRVIPHPWNLTPLGAMFLFSGAAFARKRDSLLVPLGALLVSEVFVNTFVHKDQFTWFNPHSWVAFLLVGLIGWTLRERRGVARVAGASLAGSVVFFVVSNFGVWALWNLYPMTLSGLAQCYTLALPFFRQTLLGDLAYTALMFGSWHWLAQRRLQLARQS